MLDISIIERCIEGDRIAQEKFYNYYAPKMKGLCLRYARTVFEAEDIFQEGFVKIFCQLKNIRNKESVDSWVRRVMLHTAIDNYKKNVSFKSNVSYDDLDSDAISPVEFRDNLEAEDLLKILEQIPAGYRLIFNLYAIEGYTHKEISARLGITEGTSKSQLSKARKTIQQLLPN